MKLRSEILAAPLAAVVCLAVATPSVAQTAGAKIESGVSAAATDVKAEDLTGENVRSAQNGDAIGEIKAVIIDASGDVKAVIVGVGGFLGMGAHEVAIPWEKLTRNQNDVYMLDMSKDEVKSLPKYVYPEDRGKSTAFQDPNYGMQDRMSGAPALSTERSEDFTTAAGTPRDETSGWTRSLTPDGRIKASSFVGAEVKNAQDESVGEIEEILIGSNGDTQALVSVGGFLGVGERHVLIDWSDLKIDRDKESVRVAVGLTKEQLQKLPAYTE